VSRELLSVNQDKCSRGNCQEASARAYPVCPERGRREPDEGICRALHENIKEEKVDLSDYESYTEVACQIGHFLDDVYMHKRIHSSLGYLALVEFESSWRSAKD